MRYKALPLATAAIAAVAAFAQTAAPDPVLQAMHDEIARTPHLTVSSLAPPYFVEYILDQADTFSASASLGGLISRHRDRYRIPEIHVRVGDYNFDNTNYAGRVFGSRYDLESFPIDNNYAVLRRYLWLETDSAYKAAVEGISRKRAALRNVTESDPVPDFSHAAAVHLTLPFQSLAIDENAWADRVRALSAIFASFPEIQNSGVDLNSSAGGYYVVNSEGTEVREPENVTYLRVQAVAQAPDGMNVRDTVTFHSLDPARMPSDAEMTRRVTAMAQEVVALVHAPKGEDYNGPVLFEGIAGPQIFAELLGQNLAIPRRPVTDGNRGVFFASDLEGRIGARILPNSFAVLDDPTQKEWRGSPLFGSYDVDREGVIPPPLRVVEKGVLKSYLLTRQPVRGFNASNGRARTPGSYGAAAAGISNLFVSSSDAIPAAELKKKLIDMCRQRGKPYGIIVRKMDFPSTASLAELRNLFVASEGGGRPVSLPILVYKVYPDGREELVRGLRFRGLTARSLKDIVAAGDDSTVFDFLDSPAPMALIGASSYVSEACTIAPSILVDDLEMHPLGGEQPKLPIVPPPEMTR